MSPDRAAEAAAEPENERHRHRQGVARMRDGVPYSDRETTLSLLPGAAVGEWLDAQKPWVKGRLLDVGCGNQPFAPWYGPLVDSAHRLDAIALPGVDVCGFADALPFADQTFDTLLATEVYEHVTDAEKAVRDAYRVLRPGGHLVVTVPYLYPTHEAPYDFRRFTHFGLRSLLERAGFEVVRLDAKGGPLMLVAHMTMLAVSQGLDGVGRKLGAKVPLTERRPVRAVLAGPQELVIKARRRRGRRVEAQPDGADNVTGLASKMSLGYLAVGRRPAGG